MIITTMMVIVASTTHMTALSSTLMVVCRFDVNAFIQYVMTITLVLAYDTALYLLGFIFIIKAQEDKAEATATLCQLLSHDDGVLDLAELLEI